MNPVVPQDEFQQQPFVFGSVETARSHREQTTLPENTLALYPNDESLKEFNDVLENPDALSRTVNVILYTSNEPSFSPGAYGYREEDGTVSHSDGYRQAIASLYRFPDLKGVTLHFTGEVGAPKDNPIMERDVPEAWDLRIDTLRQFFEALNTKAEDDKVPLCDRLDSLTIKNLQNLMPSSQAVPAEHDISRSPAERERMKPPKEPFKLNNTLKGIKGLHLGIATEYCEHAPETGIEMKELPEFFSTQLTPLWLEPARETLEHLTLYVDVAFGYIPRWDPRDLHFPKLKSLALGTFTFTHDYEVDWILSHAETLETLVFDDCSIVERMMVEKDWIELHKFDTEGHVSDKPNEQGYDHAEYYAQPKLKWHKVFERLRTGLPKLKDFRFGSTYWQEGSNFEDRYELETMLHENRYLIFNGGIGPSQWLAPERGQEYYDADWLEDKAPKPATFTEREKDEEALKRLVETVKERVEGSAGAA